MSNLSQILKFKNKVKSDEEKLRLIKIEVAENIELLNQLKQEQSLVSSETAEERKKIEAERLALEQDALSVSVAKDQLLQLENELHQKSDLIARESAELDKKKTDLEAEEAQQKARLIVLKDESWLLEKQINDLKADLKILREHLEREIQIINDEISNKLREKDRRDHKILELADEISLAHAELNRVKSDKERILAEIRSAKESNISALNGIQDRENKITRREKNLEILKLRFQKFLDKYYPGQNINNLI